MIYLFWVLWAVGALLQIMVLSALLKLARRFPLCFVFVIVLFLTNVVDASAFLELGAWSSATRQYFWLNEAIRQSLVFAVVISLASRALSATNRESQRKWLFLGAGLFAFLAISFSSGQVLSQWMTQTIRNLSFGSAVLNVVLWLALLRYQTADRQLLMVSGGLGLQTTGDAIGYALRQIATRDQSILLNNAGNLVAIIAHLLFLFVWWHAFRASASQPTSAASFSS